MDNYMDFNDKFHLFINKEFNQYTLSIVEAKGIGDSVSTIIITKQVYTALLSKHEVKEIGKDYYRLLKVKVRDNII